MDGAPIPEIFAIGSTVPHPVVYLGGGSKKSTRVIPRGAHTTVQQPHSTMLPLVHYSLLPSPRYTTGQGAMTPVAKIPMGKELHSTKLPFPVHSWVGGGQRPVSLPHPPLRLGLGLRLGPLPLSLPLPLQATSFQLKLPQEPTASLLG